MRTLCSSTVDREIIVYLHIVSIDKRWDNSYLGLFNWTLFMTLSVSDLTSHVFCMCVCMYICMFRMDM